MKTVIKTIGMYYSQLFKDVKEIIINVFYNVFDFDKFIIVERTCAVLTIINLFALFFLEVKIGSLSLKFFNSLNFGPEVTVPSFIGVMCLLLVIAGLITWFVVAFQYFWNLNVTIYNNVITLDSMNNNDLRG